ncbi:AAA family ATPase [Nonlabens sp. Asnod3-A02]|uniref:AAA family ATPase n=1 Tax=Nonlabens sp. Asnod3-A02 TaxID=3160579 RepID=UPI00386BB5EC
MSQNNILPLKALLDHVKSTFIGKDDVIDLLGISLIAKENTFLFGPPGTAKSAIVKSLSKGIENGKNFEYLLTRFTEPNELFGPFDIKKLREGELVTNIEGMMPEASLVFLDEIFNANSAILNSLLMALNEKMLRRGKQVLELPALMFVGASNVLPEDDALDALFDRFLIRIKCDYVHPDLLNQVLLAGWNLERNKTVKTPTITPEQIIELQQKAKKISLSAVLETYIDLIRNLRNTGITISDRRAVKIQNLIAASAVICDRDEAIISDLWVLKYIWDTEEQIEILEGIVNSAIEQEITEKSHPQALFNKAPNPEEVMKEVQILKEKWDATVLSYDEQNVIKDKLRYIQSRADWIQNEEQKTYIKKEIDALWQQILQSV